MHLKRTIAAIAASGALALAGAASTGTASAATPSAGLRAATTAPQHTPGWFLYGRYDNETECNAIGAVLVASIFDRIDQWECADPGTPAPRFWLLVHYYG